MTIHFVWTPIADSRPIPDWDALAARRSTAIAGDLSPALLAVGDRAAANRDALLRGDAVCVTTGQQPGLFLGPLYTIYKALSAIALADGLRSRLGRAVVPVFWVAGDDHDFLESGHTYVSSLEHDVARIALPERAPDAPLTPLYRDVLGSGVDDALRALWETQPPSEFRPDVEQWLSRHYRSEATVADAFASALAELLGPLGLVVLSPTHVAAKAVMRPTLLRALERAAELDEQLVTRAGALEAEGRTPPVAVGDGASLVMLEGEAGRDRLLFDGTTFQTRRAGERYTLDQLRKIAADVPERLSPNVLLRPVVEAAMLPTVAYVAGPGELAYFPQCDPVYATLDVAPQAPVARWSTLVVEQRTRKVLDRYAITPDDLQLPEGQLEQRLVRGDVPDDAERALATLRNVVTEEYDRLRDAAATVDPTLRKPVESSRNAALVGLRDIEKRIVTHLKQRNDTLVQQLARARQALVPLGRPQERVLNIVPFLVRYGRAFLDEARRAAGVWAAALEAPSDGP
jgi:bacillithiol biosynthesis cysteine-adding enzyme BshC